jgi:hypothetical protein
VDTSFVPSIVVFGTIPSEWIPVQILKKTVIPVLGTISKNNNPSSIKIIPTVKPVKLQKFKILS